MKFFLAIFLALFSMCCEGANTLRISRPFFPSNADTFLDFESGNGGDLVSATWFNNMQRGTQMIWTQSRVPQHTMVWGTNQLRLNTVTVSNVLYSGDGTRGLVFDLNLAATNNSSPRYEIFTATPPTGVKMTNLTVSGVSVFNCLPSASFPSLSVDAVSLFGSSFVTLQQSNIGGGTAGNVHIETQVSGVTYKSTPISVETNTWYDWEINFNATNHTVGLVIINHTNGVLVGTSGKINSDASIRVEYVLVQDYLLFGGGYILHDNMAWDYSIGAFPRNWITDFTPALVITDQPTNGTVRVTWTGLALTYKVERFDSGLWSTVSAAQEEMLFLDTNVVNASTYSYRVTGTIGSTNSPATNTASITINNSPSGVDTLWQYQSNANSSVVFTLSQFEIASQKIKGIQTGTIGISAINVDMAFVSTSGDCLMVLSSGVSGTGTIYGYSAYTTVGAIGWVSFMFYEPIQIPANTDFYWSIIRKNFGVDPSYQISTTFDANGYLPGQGYNLFKNGIYTGTQHSCAKFQVFTK